MKVQDILTDEKKWTKGDNAISKKGRSVRPGSRVASRFCLYGAVWRAKHMDPVYFNANATLEKIRNRLGPKEDIINWNDAPRRTFKQVRGLIEELDI